MADTGEVAGGAASGAMSGAAMGTKIAPGPGTAIGAVLGALLGGLGSAGKKKEGLPPQQVASQAPKIVLAKLKGAKDPKAAEKAKEKAEADEFRTVAKEALKKENL